MLIEVKRILDCWFGALRSDEGLRNPLASHQAVERPFSVGSTPIWPSWSGCRPERRGGIARRRVRFL